MKVLIVDDETWVLQQLLVSCKQFKKLDVIGHFSDPLAALSFAKKTQPDLAILDVDMPYKSGIQLGNELRSLYPDLLIIYCTAYDNFALDAYKLHSIAYLLKPYSHSDFEYAISTAYTLYQNCKKNNSQNNRVYIKTFGRFDVFVDNELVVFKRAKAKELLALLVDRQGGLVTLEQAINVLWETRSYDKNVKQMYRDATSQLRMTLERHNCSSLVKIVRGGCYIDVNEFQCDYYQLLKNDQASVSKFYGEYMFDYSWAEETLARISLPNIKRGKTLYG